MNRTIKPGILKDLLLDAGFSNVKQNSKSYILDCPRCKKKDKLYIRKVDGRFCCWRCKESSNFQGSPEFVFSELLPKTITELRKVIWGLDGPAGDLSLVIQVKDFFGEDDEISGVVERLIPVEPDPDFRELDSQWGEPGIAYLASRGIPLDIAKLYNIKFWPAQNRVVFPVESKGLLLGWQSRIITPDEFMNEEGNLVKIPKALTYSGLKKDRVLMFGDRITGDHAVLTEGPIDAIKAHLCGGNVASLGKAVSSFQLNVLKNCGISKLYIGLDPDAVDDIGRVVKELNSDMEIYDLRPPRGDLGGMDFESVYELYQKAPRVNPATIFIYLKDTWN